MPLTSINYGFCLFCYKTTNINVSNSSSLQSVKTFFTFLFRFSADRFCVKNTLLIEQQIDELASQSKLVHCCEECKININQFCDFYHQLKLIELQLDSKLDKLLGIVELSNKIPVRWANINKLFHQTFESNIGKVEYNQKLVGRIRQKLINSGRQRSTTAFPRILLDKNRVQNGKHLENIPSIEIKLEAGENVEINDYTREKDETFGDPLETGTCQQTNETCQYKSGTNYLLHETNKILDKPGLDCESLHNSNLTCIKCGKMFKKTWNLRRHLMFHAKNKTQSKPRFSCTICGETYARKQSLLQHWKTKHKNKKLLTIQTSVETDPTIDVKLEYPHLKICSEVSSTSNPKVVTTTSSSSRLNNSYGFVYVNCKICNKKLVRHLEKRHYKNCHDLSKTTEKSEIVNCKIAGCAAYFLTQKQLKNHRLSEHVKKPKIDTTATEVLNETTFNDKYYNKFVCKKCGKAYQYRWNFKKHICSIETNSQKLNLKRKQCDKCGRKYKTKWELANHMKNHNMDVSKELLNMQINIISIPNNPATSSSSSKKVENIIQKQKCVDCGVTCENENKMWVHQRQVHSKHVCHLCGKKLTDKMGLQVHLDEMHKDPEEWKWKCKECGKRCNAEYKLKQHMRVHSGWKPFSCHLCQEVFSHRQNIKRHLRTAHGLADFELGENNWRPKKNTDVTCKFCGRIFSRPCQLFKHHRFKHKNEEIEMRYYRGHLDKGVDKAVNSKLNYMDADDIVQDPMEILPNDNSDLNCESGEETSKTQPAWIIDGVE